MAAKSKSRAVKTVTVKSRAVTVSHLVEASQSSKSNESRTASQVNNTGVGVEG